MVKGLKGLAAILVLSGAAFAANYTGTIVDGEYKGLADVTVQNGSATTTTDAQGKFTLDVTTPVVGHQPYAIDKDIHSVEVLTLSGRVINRFAVTSEIVNVNVPDRGIYIVRTLGGKHSLTRRMFIDQNAQFPLTKIEGVVAQAKTGATPMPIVMTKTGYAQKTFLVDTDVQNRKFNFGSPIGRVFNPKAYPEYTGFQLELAEDFSAPIALNKADAVWRAGDGTWPDNATRFAPEAIAFVDGKMEITMDKMNMPASNSETEGENFNSGVAPAGRVAAKFYRSGEFRSQKQAYRYGRYEVNIDPPDADTTKAGSALAFIATMFAYHTPAETNWREADIEVVGDLTRFNPASTQHKQLTNVFFNNNNPNWAPTAENPIYQSIPNVNLRNANTLAFEWVPDTLRWYLNDVLFRTYVTNQKTAVEVSALPAKILMNFWICPCGVGGNDKLYSANKYPIKVKYDFFRFYRWDKDANFDPKVCTTTTGLNCPK